jgi:hypothetical protein
MKTNTCKHNSNNHECSQCKAEAELEQYLPVLLHLLGKADVRTPTNVQPVLEAVFNKVLDASIILWPDVIGRDK